MREDGINKIEVHVAGFCFKEDKVLMGKRAPTRSLFPRLWECCGGQVNLGEDFIEAIKRQFEEEYKVKVKVIKPAGVYRIDIPNSEQKVIPGIYFACKFEEFIEGDEPKISAEHTEWAWQSIAELDKLETIPGLIDAIKKAYPLL